MGKVWRCKFFSWILTIGCKRLIKECILWAKHLSIFIQFLKSRKIILIYDRLGSKSNSKVNFLIRFSIHQQTNFKNYTTEFQTFVISTLKVNEILMRMNLSCHHQQPHISTRLKTRKIFRTWVVIIENYKPIKVSSIFGANLCPQGF